MSAFLSKKPQPLHLYPVSKVLAGSAYPGHPPLSSNLDLPLCPTAKDSPLSHDFFLFYSFIYLYNRKALHLEYLHCCRHLYIYCPKLCFVNNASGIRNPVYAILIVEPLRIPPSQLFSSSTWSFVVAPSGSSQTHVHLAHQNVTLLENMVFIDVVKLR